MYVIFTFYTSAVAVYLRPSIITGTHTIFNVTGLHILKNLP
jgi:hypothetical protein